MPVFNNMKIPNQLKIGGHKYKITYHKTDDICEDIAAEGSSNKETGVIQLKVGVVQSEMEATLFHEIFHVMNSQLNHELLESLSQQIYQVLSDNKMLK